MPASEARRERYRKRAQCGTPGDAVASRSVLGWTETLLALCSAPQSQPTEAHNQSALSSKSEFCMAYSMFSECSTQAPLQWMMGADVCLTL